MPALQYQLLRYTPTEIQIQLAENMGTGDPSLAVHLGFRENIWQLGRASAESVLTPPHSIHHSNMEQIHTPQALPQKYTLESINRIPVSIQLETQ